MRRSSETALLAFADKYFGANQSARDLVVTIGNWLICTEQALEEVAFNADNNQDRRTLHSKMALMAMVIDCVIYPNDLFQRNMTPILAGLVEAKTKTMAAIGMVEGGDRVRFRRVLDSRQNVFVIIAHMAFGKESADTLAKEMFHAG